MEDEALKYKSPSVAGKLQLEAWLHAHDHRPYPAYHDIEGSWAFSGFTFFLDHAQADPYALPSKARVRVSHADAQFPPDMLVSSVRRTALADFLLRRIYEECMQRRYDVKLGGQGWAGGKGGQIQVDEPGQYVLERTAVVVDEHGIEVRFLVGLPARGRSIMGAFAASLLCEKVPRLVERGLYYTSYEPSALWAHIHGVEDQSALREQLSSLGLRGDSDLPADECVAFTSPPSLQVSISVPHAGTIHGMGIRAGSLYVCVGGGFHGKSTFLSAMALGSYNFVPGDGREFVCTSPHVATVRSEDGRAVHNVCIDPFISNLPNGSDTQSFSTANASGSTSCAAALMEALELGADLLVLDEDTTASNFLVRDALMQALVTSEPITPLVMHIRPLLAQTGVSVLLVSGASSAFLPVADVVVQMDRYEMKDVTMHAKTLCEAQHVEPAPSSSKAVFASLPTRTFSMPLSLDKSSTKHRHAIHVGQDVWDLHAIPQLVHPSQTRAIEALARRWSASTSTTVSLRTLLDEVERELDTHGVDALMDRWPNGFYARPRRLDIGSALNRLRHIKFQST
ncbi:hypothetical protein Malapachy_2301 [Malassezia pachydermatis]|uniref:Uncharacterized protein n=1 Tax=Malassezia pachydermatis TaxID=77020 RepID=A0A0M9VQI3_9BASI|nr:hypothetical protein Malapachy_2301 [Malassezia pachydermatis]KOS15382.1 hypothetical protein Malapachy_2301 [Malassezia pachydermatis]